MTTTITEAIYELVKKNEPVSRRRLSEVSPYEINQLTNPLKRLVEQGRLKEAFTDVCPKTQKRVTFYSLVNWIKPLEEGAKC